MQSSRILALTSFGLLLGFTLACGGSSDVTVIEPTPVPEAAPVVVEKPAAQPKAAEPAPAEEPTEEAAVAPAEAEKPAAGGGAKAGKRGKMKAR